MSQDFLKLQDISAQEREKYQSQSLGGKIALGKEVIRTGFKKFMPQNIAVAWTGGKDSTLVLWLTKQVCEEDNHDLPKVMFVDEGDVFWGGLAVAKIKRK